jgi:hypothetical protein
MRARSNRYKKRAVEGYAFCKIAVQNTPLERKFAQKGPCRVHLGQNGFTVLKILSTILEEADKLDLLWDDVLEEALTHARELSTKPDDGTGKTRHFSIAYGQFVVYLRMMDPELKVAHIVYKRNQDTGE